MTLLKPSLSKDSLYLRGLDYKRSLGRTEVTQFWAEYFSPRRTRRMRRMRRKQCSPCSVVSSYAAMLLEEFINFLEIGPSDYPLGDLLVDRFCACVEPFH